MALGDRRPGEGLDSYYRRLNTASAVRLVGRLDRRVYDDAPGYYESLVVPTIDAEFADGSRRQFWQSDYWADIEDVADAARELRAKLSELRRTDGRPQRYDAD